MSWLWSSSAPATPSANAPMEEDSAQSPEQRITDQIFGLNTDLGSYLREIDSLEERKQELEEAINEQRERGAQDQQSHLPLLSSHLQRALDSASKQRLPLEQEIKARQKELHEIQAASREEQNRLKHELKQSEASHKRQRQQLVNRIASEHQDELERVSNEASAATDAKNRALLNDLESSRQRTANIEKDIEREKKAGSADPELLSQLVRTRQENASLQKQLARLAERENGKIAQASEKLARANDELHQLKTVKTERAVRQAALADAYKDLVIEVQKYKQLLDKEEDRITPSKKRRMQDTPSS